MIATRSVTILVVLWFASVDTATGQRVRFPGDSPTRPDMTGDKPLGWSTGKRPNVPTFTIPQGGGGCWPRWDRCNWWWYRYPSYGWYGGTLWLPPTYVNANTWFGPTPGTPPEVQPHAAVVARQRAAAAADPLDRLAEAPEMEEGVPAAALERAWRYIDYGDRHLREGRPREAYSRYRKAIEAAPQLAAAHLRRGFAELAMGNIERSARAIREGVRLNPDWPRSEFDITKLLDRRELDDAVRTLADRLDTRPNDADARLLAGVVLHFNGEVDAAQEHFQRAITVTGGSEAARAFLPVQPEAEDAAALVR